MLADRENQPASAILFGKLAVNAIQRQRALLQFLERDLQDSFLDRHSAVFRNTAAFLAKAGRIAEAGRVIKMLKEYELFELLRRDPALDPRLTFAELTALEAKWQRRGDEIATILASVSEEMAALESGTAMGAADLADLTARQEAAIKDFDAWLRDAENACAAAHPAAPPVKMGGVELAPRTALLQILPGANNLHLLLTGEKFQIGREVAVGEAVLNRLIHEFRVAIEHRAEGVAPLGKVLYNHLISPVGSLRYLPFAALHDGTRYLAETMATVLFTEAAADNRAVMAAPRETNLAGFGVTREWPGFRALHAVADELARIVRDRDAASGILPGQVWLDDAFTANSLAAGLASHRAIHVASHFVFEPEAASGSYLLLGDGQHLGLTELADEKFRFSGVDLMTLSACETAMGEQAGDGSEVEGLGALVRRRGANSVVATLWPVEDASTPVLMERFYRSRAQSAMDAQALRTAQMQMLEGGGAFAHPYHWAPFIVLGGAP
jgi:hypothetical protein